MKKIFTFVIAFLVVASISHAQWVPSLEKPCQCLFTSGSTVYAGCVGVVYKTTNEGATWVPLDTLPQVVNCIKAGYGTVYAGTYSGVYKSTDNGVTFLPQGLTGTQVLALYTDFGGMVIAGTTNGVYRSTNGGANWDTPQLGGKRVSYISNGLSLCVGTSTGVYKSTNNGVSWIQDPLTAQYNVNFVEWPGFDTWIAGITGGYLWTTNGGANWFKATQASVLSFTKLDASNYLIGDSLGRVFHANTSTPSTLWDKYGGLPNTPIRVLSASNNYAFAGSSTGSNQKIWRALISYAISVKQISTKTPSAWELKQNYPNPWNPSTTITYAVPTKGLVILKVYDELGRLVATLVNEVCAPGVYAVEWNSQNIVSGVYFYTLQTSNFTDTKRMVLIK